MEQKIEQILQRVRLETLEVTPEMAREFLTHNIQNRKLNRATVELYKRNLLKGLFSLSNDAICFDMRGVLLNGQHRLTACVETRIPFPSIVARGLPTESYIIMDNGKNRCASDVLYVQDIKNASTAAAGIKRFLLLNRETVSLDRPSGTHSKISNSEIESEYKNRSEFWDNISSFGHHTSVKSKWRLLKGSEIVGMTAYLILVKKHDEDFVKRFFRQVEGLQNPTSNVITQLQQKLNESKRDATRRLLPSAKQALIIKAWNAIVVGKEYKILSYQKRYDQDIWFI